MRYRFGIVIIGILICAALLFGCSQPSLNVRPIARTEHPAALLGKLAQDLATAKKERVDLLSPTWFAQAQASYVKAKVGLDKGTELSGILSNIANGQAQLGQATSTAGKSRRHLAGAIKSRDAGRFLVQRGQYRLREKAAF